MKPVSRAGMWLRGVLYFAIGVLGALSTGEAFRQAVGALAVELLAALVAGLVAIRAFIDTSSTEGHKEPVPVTLEGQAGAVETKQAGPGAPSLDKMIDTHKGVDEEAHPSA